MGVDPVLDNVGLVGEALPLLDVLKCTFMQAARRLADLNAIPSCRLGNFRLSSLRLDVRVAYPAL